jgi:hypothetical protein
MNDKFKKDKLNEITNELIANMMHLSLFQQKRLNINFQKFNFLNKRETG